MFLSFLLALQADLQTMKQNLERKYNDAKMLKSSIDMRHNSISKMLKKYFSEEEHEDFCHFIRESPRQHIMAQELDDKIQLGEEQLQALTDSLRKTDLTQSWYGHCFNISACEKHCSFPVPKSDVTTVGKEMWGAFFFCEITLDTP